METARTRFARTMARRTLKEAGVVAPPVPIEDVLRYYGLTLARERHDPAWSGMLRGDRVVVNDAHPETRQRFTAAHELGHVRLGHTATAPGLSDRAFDERVTGGLAEPWDSLCIDPTRVLEAEANAFAGELLAPRAWIKAYHRDWRDPNRMADLFGLSYQAMWLACLRAGCIKIRYRRH